MNKNFDVDTYYDTMKPLSGINIKPEWEAMIKANISTAAKMADIVENAPIDKDSLELSNCFHPGKA